MKKLYAKNILSFTYILVKRVIKGDEEMPKIKYNPNIHDEVIWMLKSCGIEDKEIAEKMGIDYSTIFRWLKKNESFREKYEEGEKLASAKVQRSLYERATGYEKEEVDTKISYDKDGNPKPVTITKKIKHIPGDIQAIIFWLKNREPGYWKDKVEAEITGGDGLAYSLLEHIKSIDLNSLEKMEEMERELKELKK